MSFINNLYMNNDLIDPMAITRPITSRHSWRIGSYGSREVDRRDAPYNPLNMINESEPNNEIALDMATSIGNPINIHNILQNLVDEFKLSDSLIDILLIPNVKGQSDELINQLKLLRLNITSSNKIIFDIDQLSIKYPIAILMIKYQNSNNQDKMDNQTQNGENSDKIDYNELLKGFNGGGISNLTIAGILDFKSKVCENTRKKENPDVIIKYNKQLDDRNDKHLWFKNNNCSNVSDDIKNNTDITNFAVDEINNNVKINKNICLLSKLKLIEIIDNLLSIYNVFVDYDKLSNIFTHITNVVKTSFKTYCETSKKYNSLLITIDQLNKWFTEFNTLIDIVQKNELGEMSSILFKQIDNDQCKLVNMLQLSKIDNIKKQMDQASQIFTIHYQMINTIAEMFTKPNICRICMNNIADQFISTCGHIICNKCGDNLLNNNVVSSNLGWTNSANCPYCKTLCTKNDLKKIFY